jgi:hypothetical protein
MIQGDVSTRDIVAGSVTLAVLLPLLYGVGVLLARFRNRRFRKAWAPLVPMLTNATITGDGGGAATSWLSGNYRGASVYAFMSRGVGYHTGSKRKGNRFSVAVNDVAGKDDWTVAWTPSMLGLTAESWSVTSGTNALEARLRETDIVSRLEPLGRATLRFDARERTLTWSSFIEPYWVLPEQYFHATLGALLDITAVNREINA